MWCCASNEDDGPAPHHADHPVYGHFTGFFADNFNNTLGFSKMTDEEIEVAFTEMDTKKQGFLDKDEIAEALRKKGQSEKTIQGMIDNMEEETLSKEEFKALCQGKAGEFTTSVGLFGYNATVPNFSKIHEIPVLGGLTGSTHQLVKNTSYSMAGAAMGAAWHRLSDEELEKKFKELDTDNSGTLNAKQIAAALRSLKVQEYDIKIIKETVGDSTLTLKDFKAMVRHKITGSESIHDHPVAGHFTGFFADSFNGTFGFGQMTDAEIQAAFDKIDTKQQGFLDKGEIHDALKSQGKSDREINHLLDNMEEDQLNFEEFSALCKGKAEEYTTSTSIGGYDVTMPNWTKVHEVPVLGAFTSATHKMTKGVVGQGKGLVGGVVKPYSLMGTTFGAAFGNLTDAQLKEKFDEIDTEKLGKLNKNEISAVLRKMKMQEADIKGIAAAIGDDVIDFEQFKKLCGH